MHFSRFLTTSIIAGLATASPLATKGKPLPTNSGVVGPDPSCPTEAGTGTVQVTTAETSTVTATDCTTHAPAKRMPITTTSAASIVKATPVRNNCPVPTPTEWITKTITETETVTTTTACPGPTGSVPCTATGWEVPYTDYEPHDDQYGPDWWSFTANSGLQTSVDDVGMTPPSWNNYYPWMMRGFHVSPNGQAPTTSVNSTATSYEDICVAPANTYWLDILVGAVEGQAPTSASLTVKVGGTYFLKSFPVCVGNQQCISDSWGFHTGDGKRILTTEITTPAIMEGTRLPDGEAGFVNRLEVSISYPNGAVINGDNGVYVTHVWVRRS